MFARQFGALGHRRQFALGGTNTQQGERNTAEWAPPAVDNLLSDGLATSSPIRRFATYSQLVRIMQADVPYAALYREGVSIALSDNFAVPRYSSDINLMSGAYALNARRAA